MSGICSTAAHWALQYLLSADTRHVQGGCAHFFVPSVVIRPPVAAAQPFAIFADVSSCNSNRRARESKVLTGWGKRDLSQLRVFPTHASRHCRCRLVTLRLNPDRTNSGI